jgi:phage baseplate assembly protein W
MAKYYGYNAPFMGGNQMVLSQQVDDRLIRNDLLQLLLTAPGERMMRPTFGTPIRRFVFESMTDSNINQLRSDIIAAIKQFEPRVIVSDVKMETTDDNNLLSIKVYGTFNLDPFVGAPVTTPNLLVELNIPTKTSNPVT